MNTRPKPVSASTSRSRIFWPLALAISGSNQPWVSPVQMQLARDLITEADTHEEIRETTRGSLAERLSRTFRWMITEMGKAYAAERGVLL